MAPHFSFRWHLIAFLQWLEFTDSLPIKSYHCIKDKSTVHVQMPSHSTACKGISTTAQYLVSCTARCDGPLMPLWNLNTVSATDGPCEWFAYDSDTSQCNICFPYSKMLPVILDFNSTTTMKIFGLVNMTCKNFFLK